MILHLELLMSSLASEAGHAQMVQPALLVLDSEGKVLNKWSWKTMGVEEKEGLVEAAHSPVPNPDPTHPEIPEVPVLTVRPSSDDIIPAVTEGRDIKLTTVMYFGRK